MTVCCDPIVTKLCTISETRGPASETKSRLTISARAADGCARARRWCIRLPNPTERRSAPLLIVTAVMVARVTEPPPPPEEKFRSRVKNLQGNQRDGLPGNLVWFPKGYCQLIWLGKGYSTQRFIFPWRNNGKTEYQPVSVCPQPC